MICGMFYLTGEGGLFPLHLGGLGRRPRGSLGKLAAFKPFAQGLAALNDGLGIDLYFADRLERISRFVMIFQADRRYFRQ